MSSPHQHDTDFKDGKEDEKTDHTHDEIVEEGHDHSDSELLAESSPDKAKSRSKRRDDEDEEDEDEDDEDDEDGEEGTGGRRRPKKKFKRNRFLDLEVEVDDEEEDMDEDEDDYTRENEGFIDQDQVVDEDSFDARRVEREHQKLDRRRREMDDRDAEQIAAEFKERHNRSQAARFKGSSENTPQRLLMPGVEDPNLWQIRVKTGRESDIVLSLMQKTLDLELSSTPLEIYSAFQQDTLPGLVYVEARAPGHVEAAVKGLVGVYLSRGINLVPLDEMAPLLKIKRIRVVPVPHSWVRIKRGKYQGDLAQVLDVTDNGDEVGLKFIPRIDLSPPDESGLAEKKRKKGGFGSAASGSKRPEAKFFNYEEVVKVYTSKAVSKRAGSFVFQGETYKDGFIEKDMKITAIETELVKPTLDEIALFTPNDPNKPEQNAATVEDLSMISEAARKAAISGLRPGDHVEIFEGQQAGQLGLVESVIGETVTIKATHGELEGTIITAPGRTVRKNFQPGDHIKVIAGKNINETGLVISVTANQVVFLSDLSQQEVSVFSRDIREASEVGNGSAVVAQYELHDLIQLSSKTVGVICKLEREAFQVIDQDGDSHKVKPGQVNMKLDSRFTHAVDASGSDIHVGDTVQERADSNPRKGRVLHIYRGSFVFMYNSDIPEKNGVFVLRSDRLVSEASRKAKTDFTSLNPALANLKMNAGGGGGGAPMPRGRDRLIDVTVVIIKGINKGLVGLIKDINGEMARIELQSSNKTVTINKSALMRKDPKTGRTSPLVQEGLAGYGNRPPPGAMAPPSSFGTNPYSSAPTPSYPSNLTGRTPNPYASNGGRTPAFTVGKTPNAYGGATPGGVWAAGAATPRLAGARTPAYGIGNRTPGYAANDGRTPAWNADSRTPFGAGASSSRTPAGAGMSAWNATSATPAGAGASATIDEPGYGAWNDNDHNKPSSTYETSSWGGTTVPTPSALAAPTPGAYNAPTPGASGYTPGVGYAVPTPGAAPTPGAFNATTPGAYYTPGGLSAPTPGAIRDHGGSMPMSSSSRSLEWLVGLKNVMVRVIQSHTGVEYLRGKYNGEVGTLQDAQPGHKTVLVLLGSEGMNIPPDCLAPVEPDNEKQLAMVIAGQYKGSEVRTVYQTDEQWQVELLPGGGKQVIEAKDLVKMVEAGGWA